jgi:iron complex outermembrane receptor protein
MKRKNPVALLFGWLALSLNPTHSSHAAEGAVSANQSSGSLSGRVKNIATGQYLNNARVSIQGSTLLAFTDESGLYRFAAVPSGTVVLDVFYTGLDEQRISVTIPPNQRVEQHIDLTNVARYGADPNLVKLDPFLVQSTRETDIEAIAINEQRFAPNIKNVVSTESLGDPMGGSMGDFLRHIPGVAAAYGALETEGVLIRGFPSNQTIVALDGAQTAGADLGGGRSFTTSQMGVNSISRVEVTKVPLPSTPADTMAGSLNLISKSAFERSRAEFKYHVGMTSNLERFSFDRELDESNKKSYRMYPDINFDYTLPITRDLGIVITGLHSKIAHQTDTIYHDYRASGTGTGATPSNPYLWRVRHLSVYRPYERDSLSAKVDWRPFPHSVLSFGTSVNYYEHFTWNNGFNPTVGNVGTSTVAGGTVLSYADDVVYGATGRGSVTMTGNYLRVARMTQPSNLRYRFDDGRWKVDVNGSYSRSKAWRRHTERGFFNTAGIALNQPVRVNMAGIAPGRNASFEAFGNNNQPVDIFDINNYVVSTVSMGPSSDIKAVIRSLNVDVERHLDFVPFPASIKLGGLFRERTNDDRRRPETWTYNGPNGNRSAAPFLADYYGMSDTKLNYYPSLPSPPLVSMHKLYDAFVDTPQLFSQTAAQQYNTIRDRILNSKEITEEANAFYFQGEMRLLNNRLNVLGGVRYEETKNQAAGPLTDLTAVFARNANGALVRNAAGQPVRRPEAGTAGSLAEVNLIYQERAATARQSYDGFYPSLHLNYNITPNFMARAAYAQTYGRPDFGNIIPNTAVDSDDSDNADPDQARGRIRVSNINLQPWTADNYDLSLEYYTNQGGIFSAGVFRKDVDGFFGQSIRIATADDLRELSLDERFQGWQITTQFNSGSARVTGTELNARHSLAPLGNWGRSLTLFGNFTKLELEGHNQADFSGFLPKSASWGVTYSKSPFIFLAKWSYRGWQQTQLFPDLGPNASRNVHPRLQLDINMNYQLRKNLMFYINLRNATNESQRESAYGSDTPAHVRSSYFYYGEFGRVFSLGVKGTF